MRFASDDFTRAFQRTTNWTVTSPTGRSVANIPSVSVPLDARSWLQNTRRVAASSLSLVLSESLLFRLRRS
ncbi:hypothetical protein MA16_Dca028862 [Dendrobium catenatum]|uniref:Uncharacterized protein n=1 Tax=Dendrobium catenatum TaxID=906689 RepID=A0A2I0VGF7_9ASPA|nr:hypothetical protein MA16_Dca028862 [Dendrobium catenatum]